jgi:hypothetical protein
MTCKKWRGCYGKVPVIPPDSSLYSSRIKNPEPKSQKAEETPTLAEEKQATSSYLPSSFSSPSLFSPTFLDTTNRIGGLLTLISDRIFRHLSIGPLRFKRKYRTTKHRRLQGVDSLSHHRLWKVCQEEPKEARKEHYRRSQKEVFRDCS